MKIIDALTSRELVIVKVDEKIGQAPRDVICYMVEFHISTAS